MNVVHVYDFIAQLKYLILSIINKLFSKLYFKQRKIICKIKKSNKLSKFRLRYLKIKLLKYKTNFLACKGKNV